MCQKFETNKQTTFISLSIHTFTIVDIINIPPRISIHRRTFYLFIHLLYIIGHKVFGMYFLNEIT